MWCVGGEVREGGGEGRGGEGGESRMSTFEEKERLEAYRREGGETLI